MSDPQLEPDFSAPAVDGTAQPRMAPLREYRLTGRLTAEAAGTFLMVLTGVGIGIVNSQSPISAAWGFGLALTAGIIAFGYVSGGHFNPAVTLGSAVAGRTPWKSVLPYIAAQVVGACLSTLVIWVVLSSHPQLQGTQQLFSFAANGFDSHSGAQFPLTSALLGELVATAFFVAVVLGSTAHRANKAVAPFAIGLTLAFLLTFLGPITNGSLNPARSLAAAIFAEPWALEQLWLFAVAPLLGAVLAGLVYRSVDMASNASAKTAVAVEEHDAAAPVAPAAPAASVAGPAAPRAESDEARDFFDGNPRERPVVCTSSSGWCRCPKASVPPVTFKACGFSTLRTGTSGGPSMA